MRTLGLIIMLLVMCDVKGMAQNENTIKAEGCKVIDEKRPAQYISVDILHGKELVLFRLVNNCNCSVFVEVDKPYTKGESQPMFHYFLKSGDEQYRLMKGYNWTQSENFCEIEPGEHVFFDVSLKNIEKQYDLVVPIIYSWETFSKAGKTPIIHQVFFSTKGVAKFVKESRKKMDKISPN